MCAEYASQSAQEYGAERDAVAIEEKEKTIAKGSVIVMSDEAARAIKAYEDALTRVIIRSREPDIDLETAAKIEFYDASIKIEQLKLGNTKEYWDAVMRAQDAANEYFRRARQAALK